MKVLVIIGDEAKRTLPIESVLPLRKVLDFLGKVSVVSEQPQICPCGSGKIYEDCCSSRSAELEERRQLFTDGLKAFEGLVQKIHKAIREVFGPREITRWIGEVLSSNGGLELEFAWEFALFHHRLPGSSTPADWYINQLKTNGSFKEAIRAVSYAPYSVYLLKQQSDIDEFLFEDLFRKKEVRVQTGSIRNTFEVGKAYLLKEIHNGGFPVLLSVNNVSLEKTQADWIVENLLEGHREISTLVLRTPESASKLLRLWRISQLIN